MNHKLSLFFLLLFSFIITQTHAQAPAGKNLVYGKSFSETNALPVARLPEKLGQQDSISVKVTGKVKDVCQAKGCWMDIELADKSVMKVRFADYSFFVPKNIAGKTVVLNGVAHNEEVSVADQQHYAKDAGKSEAELKAIKLPKKSITFTASGVILK